ncbi:tryptophan synthase beta subunit-like PLP-dependent enzyme [Gymnopilus junonius]|uniref:Tryptophan synthase beta subunit-like PLP-dependent enzyme n=1 Tax=Gymnopilus junonius TaxID=109634 RepID=A0A9P5TG03_GYMJU|nr:tryptophan synthase beta subunit-like PLP-dependent enzyme [Gymnopilus junonius]
MEKLYSTFCHLDVAPLKKLDNKTFVLELFHGPTFAFKDVALQLFGNLFEFFLLQRNAWRAPGEKPERLTMVGATSRDSGRGRVSPIQEAQMTTVTDTNVHNVDVKGTCNDCQDIIKALFTDKEFDATHCLSAINSINWACILTQIVCLMECPTGNFGDILTGYYAKKMGLPIGKLIIVMNANDILAQFWKSGKYEKVDLTVSEGEGLTELVEGGSDSRQATDASSVKKTLNPAMDILVSSNFGHLLWYLACENAQGTNDEEKKHAALKTVDRWMSHLKSDGHVQVPVPVLETARTDFLAERIPDDLTLKTIKSFFEGKPSYVADPHMAVGLAASCIITAQNPSNVNQIILSTAHPVKFSEAVSH